MERDHIQIALLDGFAVLANSQPIAIRGVRARQTLAYLTLQGGSTVSVDRLIDALWDDNPPNTARNSVQRFVSDLRRDLGSAGSRIERADHGYRVVLSGNDRCDALELDADLTKARLEFERGDVRNAADLLSVYRDGGEPLAGLDGPRFVDVERHRLTELSADRVELAAEIFLAQDDASTAIAMLQPLTALHPFRERAVISLARALTARGRATDALDAIGTFRRQLGHELGLEPSPAIQHVELEILTHKEAQPAAAARPHAAPLPEVQETRLVGRARAVASGIAALDNAQIVTITGTGGIGKTTTAQAITGGWRKAHPGHLVRFVSLAEISAQGVVAAIGHSVGTSTKLGHDPAGEVLDRICAEVSLLVLDNCEHVAHEVALLANQIVARSQSIRILATSRSPIDVMHEQLITLDPLDESASRELLSQCLEMESVRLADLDSGDVDRLLEHLDGLPLAIELASAGLRTVGVNELLARWETNTLPATEQSGRPARHVSIASVVQGTLDQLDSELLRLLRLCAIFPTDFDLAAVEYIAGQPVVDQLRSLVDDSLLEFRHGAGGARYRMLVPIRHQTRLRLDADQSWNNAAIAHYADVSRQSLADIKGETPQRGVERLRIDLPNIAFAFDSAHERVDLDAMSAIVGAIGLANGMSPAVGAKSHLQDWTKRLRHSITSTVERDSPEASEAWRAAGWGLYGSGDGAWYLRWESETANDELECIAMAAIARFSRGQRDEAWEILETLDLNALADPFLRALLGGIGAVIAFEVGADRGHELAQLAADASTATPSPGASFFAELALASQCFVRGDTASTVARLDLLLANIDGHGLETLENMGRAARIMTVGLLLSEIDPVPNLVELIDRYLEQHSLDPGSVAMALDVAALRLHSAGCDEDAATLVGLLDRLGLSMAILRPARVDLEAIIDADHALSRARAAGALRSTFDVLASTRTALRGLLEVS